MSGGRENKALCCLNDYCSDDPAKVEAAEKLINDTTDEFFAKLNVNACYSGERGDGLSILWKAVFTYIQHGRFSFIQRLMGVWDRLDPQPDITKYPTFSEAITYGADVFRIALDGRLFAKKVKGGRPKVYDFLIGKLEEGLKPPLNINSHYLNRDIAAFQVSTLSLLIQIDKPTTSDATLQRYVSNMWGVLSPNVNLECCLDDAGKNMTVLLNVYATKEKEFAASLKQYIEHSWESLSPKPDVNAYIIDSGAIMCGVSVLWLVQVQSVDCTKKLWGKIVDGWDDLLPRPNLNAAPTNVSHANFGVTVFATGYFQSAAIGHYVDLDKMLREGTYDVSGSLWVKMAENLAGPVKSCVIRIGNLMLDLEAEVESLQKAGVLEGFDSDAIPKIIAFLQDPAESDRHKAILATCAFRYLDRSDINIQGACALLEYLPESAYHYAPALVYVLAENLNARAVLEENPDTKIGLRLAAQFKYAALYVDCFMGKDYQASELQLPSLHRLLVLRNPSFGSKMDSYCERFELFLGGVSSVLTAAGAEGRATLLLEFMDRFDVIFIKGPSPMPSAPESAIVFKKPPVQPGHFGAGAGAGAGGHASVVLDPSIEVEL